MKLHIVLQSNREQMISGAFQEQFFTCKNVGSESLMPRLVLITTGLEILLVKLILQSIFFVLSYQNLVSRSDYLYHQAMLNPKHRLRVFTVYPRFCLTHDQFRRKLNLVTIISCIAHRSKQNDFDNTIAVCHGYLSRLVQ